MIKLKSGYGTRGVDFGTTVSNDCILQVVVLFGRRIKATDYHVPSGMQRSLSLCDMIKIYIRSRDYQSHCYTMHLKGENNGNRLSPRIFLIRTSISPRLERRTTATENVLSTTKFLVNRPNGQSLPDGLQQIASTVVDCHAESIPM